MFMFSKKNMERAKGVIKIFELAFRKFSALLSCKEWYHENFCHLSFQKNGRKQKKYNKIVSIIEVLEGMVQFVVSKSQIRTRSVRSGLV